MGLSPPIAYGDWVALQAFLLLGVSYIILSLKEPCVPGVFEINLNDLVEGYSTFAWPEGQLVSGWPWWKFLPSVRGLWRFFLLCLCVFLWHWQQSQNGV